MIHSWLAMAADTAWPQGSPVVYSYHAECTAPESCTRIPRLEPPQRRVCALPTLNASTSHHAMPADRSTSTS